MWGIFLESVVIFKNYMGWHENHFLAGIYLFALIYLWLTEKDKTKRAVFVYTPSLILLLFFCPLFRKVFVRIMEDSETYYRLLWLLQMSIVSAYGLIRLMGKHRRVGLAAACLAIVACGISTRGITTIVSHVVMPLVLIPLTYLLYYEIGRALFSEVPQEDGKPEGTDKASGSGRTVFCGENLPAFMVIMALFQIFGNVSIYTTETFFLTRTWQGKAVAGSLAIPAVIWLFLLLCGKTDEKKDRRGLWMLFVCVQMATGICSSIAVFLVSMLTALTAFVLACVRRDLKLLFKFGAACIPSAVYMAVYVYMAYSYLL